MTCAETRGALTGWQAALPGGTGDRIVLVMGEHDPITPRSAAEAYPLLKDAVGPILERNEEARTAYDAMLERGLTEEEAREEIALVLLAVMFHIGARTDRLESAGGGSALRSKAFRRLGEGETAREIFEG